MQDITFGSGTVITNRNRLWRMDAKEGDVPIAISIDGSKAEQCEFHAPFKDIRPDRLKPLPPAIVGHLSGRISFCVPTAPACCTAHTLSSAYNVVPSSPEASTPSDMFSSTALRAGKTSRNPFLNRDQKEVIVLPTAHEIGAICAVKAYSNRILQEVTRDSAHVRTLAHWIALHTHRQRSVRQRHYATGEDG